MNYFFTLKTVFIFMEKIEYKVDIYLYENKVHNIYF